MKALFALATVFIFFATVLGQRVTLTGTVYDFNGAVIPKVKIAIIDERGHSTMVTQTYTNDEGVFKAELVPGEFTVRFESLGFKRFVLEKFRLVDTQKKKFFFDVVLETVDVDPCHDPTACWPLPIVEKKEGSISNEISTRQKTKKP